MVDIMGNIAAYALRTGILLSVLALVYDMLVRRWIGPAAQRTLIVGIFVVSFLSPLWIGMADAFRPAVSGEVELGLPVAVAYGTSAPAGQGVSADWQRIVALVLTAGICITAVMSLPGWMTVLGGIASGEKRHCRGATLSIHRDSSLPVFSWGRWIVCSENDYGRFGQMIIAHERAHLERFHWVDLLLAQAITVVCWFTPASWLLLSRLRDAHEFEADAAVLRGGTPRCEYIEMLMTKAVGKRVEVFANSLNHSQLIKRVTMMRKQEERSWRRLCAVLLVPAMAAGIALAAMPQVSGWIGRMESDDVSPRPEQSSKVKQKNLSDETLLLHAAAETEADGLTESGKVETAGKEAPGGDERKEQSTGSPEVFIDGRKASMEELKKISPENIASMKVDKAESPQGRIYVTTGSVEKAKMKIEYNGGAAGLMKALADVVNYPEEAKEAGIQGRAVVEMTIDHKGHVRGVELRKSAGNALLDAEALRACGELNDWVLNIPAGETAVFVMPVSFKLQ